MWFCDFRASQSTLQRSVAVPKCTTHNEFDGSGAILRTMKTRTRASVSIALGHAVEGLPRANIVLLESIMTLS